MKKIWWIIGGITLLAAGTMTTLTITNITDKLPKGKGAYLKRPLSKIKYIVVHHSAIDGYGATDYAKWHIARGWPGIGYHYVIDPDGKVNQTNSLDTVSNHVKNTNTASIGISLSGNLSKHPPTAAQMDSLVKLIKKIKKEVGNQLLVKGHGELQPTECPGKMTDMNKIRSLT
ncbi:MAG: N-acetylmuramoyl-L-alanine amidase [Bacteroidetes bacterium]|nr:N-acetylmuramoyl-L-alanine amidase [Bacteroidota bacterium]MBU1718737.1 N-acetylmuramoyl-L-alanine amidase [Bacteroidota bacterium]